MASWGRSGLATRGWMVRELWGDSGVPVPRPHLLTRPDYLSVLGPLKCKAAIPVPTSQDR